MRGKEFRYYSASAQSPSVSLEEPLRLPGPQFPLLKIKPVWFRSCVLKVWSPEQRQHLKPDRYADFKAPPQSY